jgi:hypothetical protein
MVLAFVLVVYVLPASVLGVVAGGLTSLMLRQDWDAKAVSMDVIFASVVMVVCMFVLAVMYAARTNVSLSELLGLGLTISTASVVVRHLLTPRSSN